MSKQSNERFNKLIEYIEANLYEEIDYRRMSEILGVNEYTMHRIFLLRHHMKILYYMVFL